MPSACGKVRAVCEDIFWSRNGRDWKKWIKNVVRQKLVAWNANFERDRIGN